MKIIVWVRVFGLGLRVGLVGLELRYVRANVMIRVRARVWG